MTVNVGINGFGRIGRQVLRILAENGDLGNRVNVVAVNDLIDADNLAYLLRYDSVQGRFQGDVVSEDSAGASNPGLVVNGHRIEMLNIDEGPAAIPWGDLGVDIVIEASGAFAAADKAKGHLEAGARKVLVTAPSKGCDLMVVLGVNDHLLDMDKHHVISNASCTTNCLAPLVHVLLTEDVGIEEGLMTTVHAYTSSQKAVDGPSSKDWRRGRALSNIIPATTGAAEAVGKVCPDVDGKITGMAFRIPVATVSVVDLTVRTGRRTSMDEINSLMRKASETYLKGILGYTADKVVSSDFIHDPLSSIYDSDASMALNDHFFKLVSWYDNEWGYSRRVVDLMNKLAEAL